MRFNFTHFVLASSASVRKGGKKPATFLAVFLPVCKLAPSLQEQASNAKTTSCPCSPLGLICWTTGAAGSVIQALSQPPGSTGNRHNREQIEPGMQVSPCWHPFSLLSQTRESLHRHPSSPAVFNFSCCLFRICILRCGGDNTLLQSSLNPDRPQLHSSCKQLDHD